MLNFRNTNIIFLLLVFLLLALKTATLIPAWYFVLLFAGYLAILSLGSYYVGSNFFMEVICSGAGPGKKIALTFDDGPAENYTPAIIDLLKKHQVHAAFFCIGKRICGNENIIQSLVENGHMVGNHSYSHSWFFDFFSRRKMLSDLKKMDEGLQKSTGKRPLFFRPPYGVTTPAMKQVMKTGKYTAIGWNVRSFDTVIKDENKLYKRVVSAIKPGAIILFHDTSETTLNILPALINYAVDNGYTFERLDKLLKREAYA